MYTFPLHTIATFIFQADIDLARTKIRSYCQYFLSLKEYQVFTYLMHLMLHICDDAERFRCGLGYISAYMFENFLAIFPKVF